MVAYAQWPAGHTTLTALERLKLAKRKLKAKMLMDARILQTPFFWILIEPVILHKWMGGLGPLGTQSPSIVGAHRYGCGRFERSLDCSTKLA
eukprot:COSAG02_NODE_4206_length_5626_cov_10.092619_10_plen_92_part_00